MVMVRFFAGFREKVNQERMNIPIERETTLGDFINTVKERFPSLGDVLQSSRATIAVNHEVVEMNHVIKNSDEVALFPPVSGG